MTDTPPLSSPAHDPGHPQPEHVAELVPSRARTAEIAGSPMSDTPPLTIVRDPAWQALVRRLEAAVSRDRRLAEARDVVLRPIELLRVMAADAHGALADDVLRGDRPVSY